jgi:hypothetical protein
MTPEYFDVSKIGDMRFTDKVKVYQLDEVKRGSFMLRPIGDYPTAPEAEEHKVNKTLKK